MPLFQSRLPRKLALLCALALSTAPAIAQPMMPSGGPAGPKPLAPDDLIKTVGVDQNLDAQISPDLKFVDETGKTVRLGDYFGKKKPLLLSLVYYQCPGLCTMTLNGIATSLKPLKLTPGKEFDILTVSFDPREKPELAAAKKKRYLKEYGRAEAAPGWHFLTGEEADIQALCKTVGFRFKYDEATKQYAHAAAIMVVTPQGKVSRYFYGLEYSSRDIQLGLIEASEERIGSISDAVTLFCYAYDPASGKYSLLITRILKVFAALTIVSMGGLIGLMLYRERRSKKVDTGKFGGGEPATQVH